MNDNSGVKSTALHENRGNAPRAPLEGVSRLQVAWLYDAANRTDGSGSLTIPGSFIKPYRKGRASARFGD
jgi:hypothetical protein